MNELSILKRYLLVSIKKHGNQPLTLQHLVNLIGVIEREEEAEEKQLDNISFSDINSW
jgi:hypothetical protein